MKSKSTDLHTLNSGSRVVEKVQCPSCRDSGRDNHRDNFAIYDDGHGYCFGCGYTLRRTPKISNTLEDLSSYSYEVRVPKGSTSLSKEEVLGVSLKEDNNKRSTPSLIENSSLTKEVSKEVSLGSILGEYPRSTPRVASLQVVPHRGLTDATLRQFDVKVRVDEKDTPFAVQLPYGEPLLIRSWDHKSYHWEGYTSDAKLFGMDRFSAGQSRSITICESAYDAMSAYQLLGSRYPSVGVRSASTARGDCERFRDYLNSFERIYLCFDNDVAGENAARECSKLFDINKVYHVKLTKHKDVNEYLTSSKDDAQAFVSIWYNSRPYLPRGIINSYEDVEKVLARSSDEALVDYPHSILQDMTGGIRAGEVNLITAQEGVGKTEFLRTLEYQVLKHTTENVAIIHLEEGEKRATQGLIGYELSTPVHLPDSSVSIEDQILAYKQLTRNDGRLHFYAHFGSDDPNTILDIIRYLVAVCHCKFVFLDHITMLVTGFEDEDERKKLDYLSTRLAMLTRELGFCLFLVSHVNDDGKTRGSRNISKVADLVLFLERDTEASSYDSRTTTSIMVKKNRYTGKTGPAGYLKFNPKTFKLEEWKDETPEIDFLDASPSP